MNDKRLVHRILKSSNILLSDDHILKLTDFDHMNEMPQKAQNIKQSISGKRPNFAPEMILGYRNDIRSDIFSLGCVIYELCAF